MKNPFGDADEKLSALAEDAAKQVGRRRMLTWTVKGLSAALAGLTVGRWVGMPGAEAHPAHRSCHYFSPVCSGQSCTYCPAVRKTCPSGGGCPSGCVSCRNNDCSGYCPYSNGQWTSAPGCGRCADGFYICSDCKCTACNRMCVCSSACLCQCCSSPADVQAELERLQREGLVGV